jgi:hypothetical protein
VILSLSLAASTCGLLVADSGSSAVYPECTRLNTTIYPSVWAMKSTASATLIVKMPALPASKLRRQSCSVRAGSRSAGRRR